MERITPEQFKKQYGDGALAGFGQPTQKPGYFQRVGQGIKETFTGLGQDLQTQADVIAQPDNLGEDIVALGRGGLRTAGAFAKSALTPLMEAPGIKQASEFVGEQIADTAPMQKFAEWAGRHPEAAKDIENTLDIAGLLGTASSVKPLIKGVAKGVKAVVPKIGEGVKTGLETGKQAIGKGKEVLLPKPPTPKGAMGQVLQGKTKDIGKGFQALKEVDTTGVKTYQDLGGKINESITRLAGQVDESLDNSVPIKLNQLKTTAQTTGGKTVSTNYVDRALKQMEELYTKIGDDVTAQNTKELIRKAQTTGLTRFEVNNIARQYGMEFGEKAFGKMGDPLTSVNAKMFEGTRKGLKSVARQGIGGDAAKAADESISSLYRTQKLIKNNIEAVNKLQQKIQERGFLEKVGYNVAKYTDILTGGGLRGVVGGLLPRGVGNKIMNAIDLEKALQRNLEIIQKALKSDDYAGKLLKKISKQGLKASP